MQPMLIFFLPLPASISAQQDLTSSILILIPGLGIALRLWATYKATSACVCWRIGVIKIIAFDYISILEIDFSLNLVSVIPSISALDSREHNSSSRRFRFLDRLLILQWRIESRFCLRI